MMVQLPSRQQQEVEYYNTQLMVERLGVNQVHSLDYQQVLTKSAFVTLTNLVQYQQQI